MSFLTQDDKQNIRDVWAKVFENAEENGKVVVIRLFVDHPETKKYFKNFKNIATEEELEKNARVKLHGKKVMNALNEVVENMDLLFEVIINVYKDALGASFTPPICESWRKVFKLLFDFLEAFYTNTSES
ncbi:UNVERIFIED_CONTAM: hypothetical protein FKN15_062258 [Acipenser sinensis]